jgi:mRNA-degrading endonuclease RelE of RelBE toxin-antitoxin system
MVFIETLIFTKYMQDYLNDEDYRELQSYLAEKPNTGSLLQGTGGLRKIRWSAKGKGKRGDVRIIYYWQVDEEQIYLLTIYAKNEMTNLSENEKQALRNMIERW